MILCNINYVVYPKPNLNRGGTMRIYTVLSITVAIIAGAITGHFFGVHYGVVVAMVALAVFVSVASFLQKDLYLMPWWVSPILTVGAGFAQAVGQYLKDPSTAMVFLQTPLLFALVWCGFAVVVTAICLAAIVDTTGDGY